MTTSETLVSDDVVGRAAQYNNLFVEAKPFRHVVIDGFFKRDVAERMLAEFPAVEDADTLLNEFGDPGRKSQISEVRALGGIYADVDTYIQGNSFLELISRITGIPELRYDPYYFGAGTHENLHGAGLDAHYDFNIHPKTREHRRLNAIVYLNKDWEQAWKGALALHSDPWDLKNDVAKEISPTFNRCVIFETNEHSWHSVIPVDLPNDRRELSRKSFTIYLYTNNRPSEEAAPEHGTIYVQAPLPKHIRAGLTLTDADMAEIESNIQRRHYMLKNLYKREYKFAAIIDDLKAQVVELRAHSNVPLLGYGKVPSVAEPLYSDGWLGRRLSFSVDPQRPVYGLRLSGWSAEDVTHDIEVTLSIGETETIKTVRNGSFNLPLWLMDPIATSFDVSVGANWTRQASEADERPISVIINAIELVH